MAHKAFRINVASAFSSLAVPSSTADPSLLDKMCVQSFICVQTFLQECVALPAFQSVSLWTLKQQGALNCLLETKIKRKREKKKRDKKTIADASNCRLDIQWPLYYNSYSPRAALASVRFAKQKYIYRRRIVHFCSADCFGFFFISVFFIYFFFLFKKKNTHFVLETIC